MAEQFNECISFEELLNDYYFIGGDHGKIFNTRLLNEAGVSQMQRRSKRITATVTLNF